NELWVHVGDSITWTFPAGEVHTVTFLKPGQVRPSNGAGCPGTTPDQSNFDSSACVNSGSLLDGRTYTVNFPTAGNFKVVCLTHTNMTGAVHVLEQSEALPYQQAFYDDQANTQRLGLLKDGAIQLGLLRARAQQNPGYQVNAGFLVAAPQDRTGLAQTNLGVTRFRVTFTTPGTFDYICTLHDEVGMTGRVIVH